MARRLALAALAALALAAPARAAPKPAPAGCVDKPYKDYECAKQTLWGNCTKPEWAGYCDETCGRCPSTYALVPGSLTPSETEPGVATAVIVPAATTQPGLGPDLATVDVTLSQITPAIARVRLGAKGRWEVPRSIFTNVVTPSADDATADPLFELETQAEPFAVRVRRAGESGPALFDTSGRRLVLKDQYLEISTLLPSTSRVYGLGESTATTGMLLPRDGKPHTLWNHDSPSAYPGPNMYGSWPVIMDVRPDGRAHGILLVNSNGMDVSLTQDAATFRVIGGVLDFYVLTGPTPLDVHDQITQIIGRPFLPPYWSLGLMQSKYGYQSVDEFETAVSGYANASLPLETFVADSQYMDNDQDFTLGEKFPADRMRAFTARLHGAGQRFVPILDPVIHISKGYDPYDSGIKAGIFVKDQTGAPYVAQLWPGAAHLPDYMHPKAPAWWQDQIKTMFDEGINPDGIWLDMNEVSNYCTGDVCKATRRVPPNNKFVCELVCESGPTALGRKAVPALPPGLYNPPYAINNGEDETPLGHKTLPITARHHGGVLEYDVHNLYGHIQSIHTAAAMRNLTGKRAFVFTRSSFLGTGAVAAHWTGDTASTWDDMRNSVPMLFQSGLAGIPFVGADICGFMKYASEELCARWAALGAWYPYSRNHHADGYQEFWRWPKVTEAARAAYAWRYRALPHMYTAFADARARGCPVARPLLFGWPADANTTNLYEQIMIGDGLLVSPVLKGGRTATDAYFPAGTWHSLLDGSTIDARAGGKTVTLNVGLTDAPPLHIAGGAIIPLGQGGLTTRAARASPLTIVAALPRPGAPAWQRCGAAPPPATDGVLTAAGSMFHDDGDSVETGPPRTGSRAAFSLRVVDDAASSSFAGTFNITWPALAGGDACDPAGAAWPTLDDVKIVGVAPVRASSVRVSVVPKAGAPRALTPKFVSFDDATGTLRVGGLRIALECGTDVRLSFEGAGSGAGRVKDTSSKRPIKFDPAACDCDDVAPTPDFTCPQQASFNKCGDGFMYGFCKKSCGTCRCDTEAGTPAPPKKGSQFSQ